MARQPGQWRHAPPALAKAGLVVLCGSSLLACQPASPPASPPQASPSPLPTVTVNPVPPTPQVITNARLCASPEPPKCTTELTAIAPDTQTFYLLGDISALPPGTKLQATLTYVDGPAGQNVAVVTTESTKQAKGNLMTYTFQRPKQGWPPGQYEVRVAVNGQPLVRKPFTVAMPELPSAP